MLNYINAYQTKKFACTLQLITYSINNTSDDKKQMIAHIIHWKLHPAN